MDSGPRDVLLYPNVRRRALPLAAPCAMLVLAGLLLNVLASLDGRRWGLLASLAGFALLAGMVAAGYRSACALGALLRPEPSLALTRRGVESVRDSGDVVRWRDIRDVRLFTSGGRTHLGLVLANMKLVCITEDEVDVPLTELRARIEAHRRELRQQRRTVGSSSGRSATASSEEITVARAA
jgi:hypothetical protein